MTQPYILNIPKVNTCGHTTRNDYIGMISEKRISLVYDLNLRGMPHLEMGLQFNNGSYQIVVYTQKTPFFCTEIVGWVEFKKNVIENYNLWVVHQVINE